MWQEEIQSVKNAVELYAKSDIFTSVEYPRVRFCMYIPETALEAVLEPSV